MGRIGPPQPAARSPGRMSTCRDHRHDGQWFRKPPETSGGTAHPHRRQVKLLFSIEREVVLEMTYSAHVAVDIRGAGFRSFLPPPGTRRGHPGLRSEGHDSPPDGDYFRFLLHRTRRRCGVGIRTSTGFSGHCHPPRCLRARAGATDRCHLRSPARSTGSTEASSPAQAIIACKPGTSLLPGPSFPTAQP